MRLTNPRLTAVLADYPLGGDKRGEMRLTVETGKRGQRLVKQSTGKPKADTFAVRTRIVDGEDGRTYILKDTGTHITVGRITDFKNAQVLDDGKAVAFSDHPQWEELKALFV